MSRGSGDFLDADLALFQKTILIEGVLWACSFLSLKDRLNTLNKAHASGIPSAVGRLRGPIIFFESAFIGFASSIA